MEVVWILLLLFCIGVHLFMMRGHGHAHGGDHARPHDAPRGERQPRETEPVETNDRRPSA
ncbi:DUF2933 domain-containing protein [Limnochorda pilosa]|uniref:DUF2933 domain-containing protein n=1 Tax=Limnochorda pilosa TaxID=1555112 RepID=A0A0K2SQ95_LIMPI|nr:DUF2933 domain-containing protein [Limnochorda pilosa]BAS29271.1 hypothetical protein LIP_3459 [Limnochorda pilosa]